MKHVFLDTVGLIAVWDKRDQWHQPASVVYRRLIAERARLFTSEFVLLECANAASRTSFRAAVSIMRSLLLESKCVLVPDEGEHALAWETYREHPAGQPGVVDLLSFSLMRRYGIPQAFTNDAHFRNAGFITLF